MWFTFSIFYSTRLMTLHDFWLLCRWEPTLLAGRVLRAWYLTRAGLRQVNRVFRKIGLFIAPSKHLRDRFEEIREA